MKFTGSMAGLKFDTEGYRKKMHEQLSEEIALAAFTWLETVLAEIPVWSGASWATFLRLSREVGYNLSISPKAINRIPYGQRHGDGEVKTDSKKGLYTFTYSTTLAHLISNEFNHNTAENDPTVWGRLKRPGPYNFQKAGQKAFEKMSGDVRLPSPWKSLKVSRQRI
jgi:hypothetical protein